MGNCLGSKKANDVETEGNYASPRRAVASPRRWSHGNFDPCLSDDNIGSSEPEGIRNGRRAAKKKPPHRIKASSKRKGKQFSESPAGSFSELDGFARVASNRRGSTGKSKRKNDRKQAGKDIDTDSDHRSVMSELTCENLESMQRTDSQTTPSSQSTLQSSSMQHSSTSSTQRNLSMPLAAVSSSDRPSSTSLTASGCDSGVMNPLTVEANEGRRASTASSAIAEVVAVEAKNVELLRHSSDLMESMESLSGGGKTNSSSNVLKHVHSNSRLAAVRRASMAKVKEEEGGSTDSDNSNRRKASNARSKISVTKSVDGPVGNSTNVSQFAEASFDSSITVTDTEEEEEREDVSKKQIIRDEEGGQVIVGSKTWLEELLFPGANEIDDYINGGGGSSGTSDDKFIPVDFDEHQEGATDSGGESTDHHHAEGGEGVRGQQVQLEDVLLLKPAQPGVGSKSSNRSLTSTGSNGESTKPLFANYEDDVLLPTAYERGYFLGADAQVRTVMAGLPQVNCKLCPAAVYLYLAVRFRVQYHQLPSAVIYAVTKLKKVVTLKYEKHQKRIDDHFLKVVGALRTECTEVADYIFGYLDGMKARIQARLRKRSFFGETLSGFDEVFPGLYIGGYHLVSDKKVLRAHGITHIVSTIGMTPFPKDFSYCTVEINDDHKQDIASTLEAALPFMHKAFEENGIILCHCGVGASRSGAVGVAFLCELIGCTVVEAIALCRQSRSCIKPNPNFVKQLSRKYGFEQ